MSPGLVFLPAHECCEIGRADTIAAWAARAGLDRTADRKVLPRSGLRSMLTAEMAEGNQGRRLAAHTMEGFLDTIRAVVASAPTGGRVRPKTFGAGRVACDMGWWTRVFLEEGPLNADGY